MKGLLFSRVLFQVGAALIVSSVAAENWSDSSNSEHPPATIENRIIKWCKSDGSGERYASANIKIPGYQPCGKLTTQTTCDPVGNKFIGSGKNAPRAYQDCAQGPRLIVERTDLPEVKKEEYWDDSKDPLLDSLLGDDSDKKKNNNDPSHGPPPLSSRERQDLERTMKDLKQNDRSIEKALQQLIKPLFGSAYPPSKNKQRRNVNNYRADKEIKRLLQNVAPADRKMLEKVLGRDILDQLTK